MVATTFFSDHFLLQAGTVDPDIASTYGKRQYQVDQKDIPLKRMIAGGLSSNLIRYIAIYAYYSSR